MSKVYTSHPRRSQLPHSLMAWRVPGRSAEAEATLWESVRDAFNQVEIDLWPTTDLVYHRARPGELYISNGFAYFTPQRHEHSIGEVKAMNVPNALNHAATTAEGHNVVVRVIRIGKEGEDHLRVLRRIACGPSSLLTSNHAVPLWREVHLEDIVFGVFPFVGARMGDCYMPYTKNSVGDILDMLLQCLDALAYIHSLGIMHRDADKENFLVQWHPESLATMTVPIVRPRVYLNDLELAIELPPETSRTDIRPLDGYMRDIPPEVAAGGLYDPFKADIWQFAISLADFWSTEENIDGVLERMLDKTPANRPTASEARDQIAAVVHSLPPTAFLIAPNITK